MTFEVTRTFDILERLLAQFPRKDALGGKNQKGWYTYTTEEYVRFSHHLAMGLMAKGFVRGDKIATVTNNRPEWNFADMAMAMTGIIHVPIYPTISDEEYNYILNHAEVKAIFVGERKLYERLHSIASGMKNVPEFISFENIAGVVNYMEIIEIGSSRQHEFETRLSRLKNEILPDDITTIIYTSGTTGIPKGVMLSHRNLVSNFIAHSKMHNLGEGHRALSFLPLCHVYERSMNYHFQYKGMGVYYVGNLGQIVTAIKEIQPHMFNCVPRLLERIYDGFLSKGKELKGFKKIVYFWAIRLARHFEYYKRFNLFIKLQIMIADDLIYSKWREALGNNIKYIVSGGAALQPQISRVLGMAGITNLEGYGLTETSPVIAVNNPLKGSIKIGTVGEILPGVEVKFGQDNEILVKGPSIMVGYYKAPELTAEVIDKDGWFHTGDIGMFVDGKYLKITDRKKEMFKLSGGKYIAPQVIENKLKESFFIEQVMVIGNGEKFASAIISPNFLYLHDWCSQHKISYQDNDQLIHKTEVLAQLQREVTAINKTLGEFEEIKRFRLVADEWTPQSGELSPTLKLKRNYIFTKYKSIINEIYSVSKTQPGGRFRLPKINLNFDIQEFIKHLKL